MLQNDQLRKDTEDLEEKDRKNEESFQSQLGTVSIENTICTRF